MHASIICSYVASYTMRFWSSVQVFIVSRSQTVYPFPNARYGAIKGSGTQTVSQWCSLIQQIWMGINKWWSFWKDRWLPCFDTGRSLLDGFIGPVATRPIKGISFHNGPWGDVTNYFKKRPVSCTVCLHLNAVSIRFDLILIYTPVLGKSRSSVLEWNIRTDQLAIIHTTHIQIILISNYSIHTTYIQRTILYIQHTYKLTTIATYNTHTI